MCGLILEFQKICVYWAKIWHWHKTRRSFGKVCPLGYSGKVRACQIQGGKRSHFHVNNSLLVLPFLLFLMLHEDQFCGFVELTCVTRTSKNAVSPRDQKRRPKSNCRISILMTCHSPGSGKCFWLVVPGEKIASTNRKHYSDLGSDM